MGSTWESHAFMISMLPIVLLCFYDIHCIISTFIFSSAKNGWLNPPLHFNDEPCRHKILDLIGDLSLVARSGNQGFPVAHIVAYKVNLTFTVSQLMMLKYLEVFFVYYTKQSMVSYLNYARDLWCEWFLMRLMYAWCRVAMHCMLIWRGAW